MSFPDSKTLKKLADSCRKAGIKHFKHGDIEFTLSDEAPVSAYKRTKNSLNGGKSTTNSFNESVLDQNFKSEELTQEQLLFYSVVDPLDTTTEQQEGNS